MTKAKASSKTRPQRKRARPIPEDRFPPEEAREILEARRARLLVMRERQRADQEAMMGERTGGDEADQVSGAQTLGLLGQLRDSAGRDLLLIDAALRRIEAGSYGICARCEEPIDAKRLRAVPWATLCVGCAEASS